MFPSNTGFAEVESIFSFHPVHPVNDRMADLRLKLADKAVKGSHLDNGHETQAFQQPALAGNDVECMVKGVKASVSPSLAFKMMSSQVCLPRGEFGQESVSVYSVGGFRFQSHTLGRNIGEVKMLPLVLAGAT
jgi:hypothetical protein